MPDCRICKRHYMIVVVRSKFVRGFHKIRLENDQHSRERPMKEWYRFCKADNWGQLESSPTPVESTRDTNQDIGQSTPDTNEIVEQNKPTDQDIHLSLDTTADSSLRDDVTERVTQYLEGRKLEEGIKAKEVILTVWDFAGQHIYYATHPVFLSHRAIYLLVYNHSKDLGAEPDPINRQGTHDLVQDYPINQTNMDDLLSWLVSVQCIRRTTDETIGVLGDQLENLPYIRPPVLIVGTHADEPFEETKKMHKSIEKNISGKTFEKHLVRPLFSVDNTRLSIDDGVESLQKKIIEVLEQEPYMGEEVPIRWFKFEKMVKELLAKEIFYMGLDKLLKVTKQVCSIDDEEELKAMLNFYHDLGVIVKHGHTVVLQVQWLIDLFKQLIVVRGFNKVAPKYAEYWQELERSGHLNMALVDHVFDEFIQKGLSKQDILDMMELYGLIAKFKGAVADEQRYFVPAQLKSSPSGLCEIKPSDCDPCILYLNFPDGFVPHGLFPQLLSRCISWCSERGPNQAPELYQNGARLFLGKKTVHYLIMICRKRFIKIVLKEKKKKCVSASPPDALSARAREVHVFLKETLGEMSHELSWLHGLQYELCVACNFCLNRSVECDKHRSVCCAHDDCLHLLPLSPEEEMICKDNFDDEPVAPVGVEKWLVVHETEESSYPSVTPRETSYTSQKVPGQQAGSTTTLKVTLLGDEWASSAGGLSTLNRELAIHLAKQPGVEVTFFVPESSCTDEQKKKAHQRYGITVVEAKEHLNYDRLDLLSFPPRDLAIDVVVGHGMKLGYQGQVLKDSRSCKWVQVVHTAPEQLSMFKMHSGAISKGGKKHQTEVGLCKLADLVVPIGPKLAEAYSSCLRSTKDHDILPLIPGLFSEFEDLKQDPNESFEFKVLLCGRGDAEDFELKGYDIAAKAFAEQELKGEPYRLLFVGAPDGKQDEVARKLLKCGIAKEQLTVRKFIENREKMKDLFCEVDVAIMPSRTEGFGLIALEALSAGLPILVSANSGFAKALQSLQYDTSLCIVDSKEPKKWAKTIKDVRARHGEQLHEIKRLRKSYGNMYSWDEQCEALAEKMWNMVHSIS